MRCTLCRSGSVAAAVCGVMLTLASATLAQGQATVVWVSVDGVRGDSLDRAETPTLDNLIDRGVHTRGFTPTFPSGTFPVHVSKATGVTPATHGITGNSFYDARDGQLHRYPHRSALIEAEPIWTTATRQGVRVMVGDWPVGHAHEGEHAAAHFGERFVAGRSDRQRLERLIDTWDNDDADAPLRLVMGWIGQPDRAGHRHGPDSDEIVEAMQQTDTLLAWFVERVRELWARDAGEGDELYVIISTDHGMRELETLVHPNRLTGLWPDDEPGVSFVTGANMGHVHLDGVDDAARRARIAAQLREAGQEHAFLDVYRRDERPDRWGYAHAHRTGDVVLVLAPGYTFNRLPRTPTAAAPELGTMRGMHGYDAAEDEQMLGFAVVARWPAGLGGERVERVDARVIHAMVARLLGIEPADAAMPADGVWGVEP